MTSGSRCKVWLVVRQLVIVVLLLSGSPANAQDTPSTPPAKLERIEFASSDGSAELTGSVIAEAPDGTILVLRPNGSVHLIMAAQKPQRMSLSETFRLMDADELSRDLLLQTGDTFGITRTEHYVICSASSDEYAAFCGDLLELVYEQYFDFFGQHEAVKRPANKLPIIVLGSTPQFQEFAQRQHPDISFEDTPGYYSVRDNSVMLLDLSGDPRIASRSAIRRHLAAMPRQMATVVHEAVHQLAFNSGLQVRMADNPLWFSEGLALYFETGSERTRLLWNRPGRVNAVHHPTFVQLANGGTLPISISELIQSDQAFEESEKIAAAYAESWALVTFLISREREGFDKLATRIAERKALVGMSPEQRLREFEDAVGKSADEIEELMTRYVSRLRPTR